MHRSRAAPRRLGTITLDLLTRVASVGVTSTADDSIRLLPYLQDPLLDTPAARHDPYAKRFEANGFARIRNTCARCGTNGTDSSGATEATLQRRGSASATYSSATLTTIAREDADRFKANR